MTGSCERCHDSGEIRDLSDPLKKVTCPDCCPHDEHDHGICLECGKDILDDLIVQSDFLEDR